MTFWILLGVLGLACGVIALIGLALCAAAALGDTLARVSPEACDTDWCAACDGPVLWDDDAQRAECPCGGTSLPRSLVDLEPLWAAPTVEPVR